MLGTMNPFSSIIKKVLVFINKPTFKNILIVGGVTVLVKVIAFFKETVIASNFGLSQFLDAFLIAILIPSFLQSVFVNSFKNIFIPNYVLEMKQENKIGEFQSVALLSIVFITIVTVVVTYILSDVFLAYLYPGHDDGFYDLIKLQLNLLLPCLFLWSISSFLSGLLEIKGKFFTSSLYAIFIPLATLICIYFFSKELGEYILAFGTLLGSFFGLVFLLFSNIIHNTLTLKRPRLNENARLMLKQLPPKVSSSMLTGANNFVDQYFAAQLAIGSIAAMNYGMKIPSFLLGIAIIAIGNVLLPYFSIKVSDNLIGAYKEVFKILKGVFLSGLIITLLIFIFSEEIIAFLFEKKEFTSDDTIIVARIQQILLVYIPFYLCGNILVKFLTSINKNSFMAWQSFYKLVANIILNIILVKTYGIFGLAIATTIVITANSIIYLLYTIKQYNLEKNRHGEVS